MQFTAEDFILDKRFHLQRHILFWLVHFLVFCLIGYSSAPHVSEVVFVTLVAIPLYMVYIYPAMYLIVPRYLIREKYRAFFLFLACWVVLGLLLNFAYRSYVLIPLRMEWASKMAPYKATARGAEVSYRNIFAFGSFFAMNTMLGFGCMFKMFQYWMRKQKDLMVAEKEKIGAELQMLKAQVHPHFLFNTLNNIYSAALEHSPKTPHLIMKLSQLLSYMLYECKADEVPLEREIEILKSYVALETERYGDRIDISLNFEGDIHGKQIAPLLFLPFIENAFKHGASEALDRPWLSVDLSVRNTQLRCKIINSSQMPNEPVTERQGIGIRNVCKRLELIYPGRHSIQLSHENHIFMVSLSLLLSEPQPELVQHAEKAELETVEIAPG